MTDMTPEKVREILSQRDSEIVDLCTAVAARAVEAACDRLAALEALLRPEPPADLEAAIRDSLAVPTIMFREPVSDVVARVAIIAEAHAARAVEAERERCAKLAASIEPPDCNFVGVWREFEFGVSETQKAIATAIREGKK